MLSATSSVRQAALALIVAAAGFQVIPARADDGFPFGLEMTLDVAPQPGSKRLPTLEIGDSGEATLALGGKAGKGQFWGPAKPVAFVPAPLRIRPSPPSRPRPNVEPGAPRARAPTRNP